MNKLYQSPQPHAVLLINLGTPEKASLGAIFSFLRQFLSDKRVINLPRFFWLPLLYLIILPLRIWPLSKKYKKIWHKSGSPLRVYCQSIHQQLQRQLPQHQVYLAMRYGSDNIAKAVTQIIASQAHTLTVIPLFPQYSDTTSGTCFHELTRCLSHYRFVPSLNFMHDFCFHPQYIQALAQSVRRHWSIHGKTTMLLISFHGLPSDSLEKGDPYSHCCQTTAHHLAQELRLSSKEFQVVFQSRFGPKEWLKPYAEAIIRDCALNGHSITLIAPSFYCDCLETLEELEVEYRKLFMSHGGKTYSYIPCLNDSKESITFLTHLIDEMTTKQKASSAHETTTV